MSGLLIVGAGGHGKVVADTAYEMSRWGKIAFLDDRYPSLNSLGEGPVLGVLKDGPNFLSQYSDLVVAIGNNRLRVELLRFFQKSGFNLPNIVHPNAFVSGRAILEAGIVIFPQAVVNTGAIIGFGSIINTGASVDHDCRLGEGVHLSPGVRLAGEVRIGNYSSLGIGSSVIQQICINDNVIIGAGSVVIEDVSSNSTVVGVPGKVIKKDV